MNLTILGKLLGILLMFAAVWSFDKNNTNQIIISTALFLFGLNNLLTDVKSDFLQMIRRILLITSGMLGVFLLFKTLFI